MSEFNVNFNLVNNEAINGTFALSAEEEELIVSFLLDSSDSINGLFTVNSTSTVNATFIYGTSPNINAVFKIDYYPMKMSQLENDADYVQDADYVHTDNNFTDIDKTNLNNQSGVNTGDITVTDSSEIDFTLTGQSLTASIKNASIDETKLDVSVNASLDLADSALQSFTEADPVFSASPASNVIDTGDGTMYLSDDGTYKVVEGGVTSVNGQVGDVTLTIPDQLSDLTDDSTHRLVTDAQIGIWDSKADKVTITDKVFSNGYIVSQKVNGVTKTAVYTNGVITSWV